VAGTGKQGKVVKSADEKASESPSSTTARSVEIPAALSVRQLAELLQVSPVDAIKQLMRSGIMANINQVIDYESAAAVAANFGYEVILKPKASRKSSRISEMKKHQKLLQAEETDVFTSRPPVVTIMGHVNHGKTKLLDTIRETNVMDTEAGGITQHIGAYQVEVNGQKITFLDTPGHEAFTAMRARGAQVTDITILVVAADDGVMPQTLEAIDHARAAGVPIVVAINKIDKPEANPERVKQQLADAGLVVEGWGGDTVCVDLKADSSRPAEGVVIEAEMDKSKGPLGTVLVGSGTLKLGDTVAVGDTWGRVKAMFNDAGKRVKRVTPATPVEILGLNSVPQVGDILTVVSNERQAQALVEEHKLETEKESSTRKSVNLTNVLDQISSGRVKELNIILKADVQGSIEPIRSSLEQLAEGEVKVRIIHVGSGNITESDIMLAIASKAVIIGFNTDSETGARRLAEVEGVSIRYYDVIYNLVDDVGKALKGLLEPSYQEVIDGRAEVRAIFSAGKKAQVAGVYVTEGKITRGGSVRVQRQGETVVESVVSSLRRFKDDVREVTTGYECGVGVRDFGEFEVGDILEFFRVEEAG